jgi:hypothetical protein
LFDERRRTRRADAAGQFGPSPLRESRPKVGVQPGGAGDAFVVSQTNINIDAHADRRLVAGFLSKMTRWMPIRTKFALRSSRPYAKRLKFLSWKGGRVV